MTKEEAIKQAIITNEWRPGRSGISGNGNHYFINEGHVAVVDPNKLAKFLSKFVEATAEDILEVM